MPADRPPTLADLHAVAASAAGQGAVWRLTDSQDLHANLVRLAPHGVIEPHFNPDLDVLFVGVAGEGTLDVDDRTLALRPGALVVVPRNATRSVRAGREPLVWLSVHRRRAGVEIRRPSSA